MAYIHLTHFMGERPRVDPRLLPNEAATQAINCHFYHGNLAPLNGLKLTNAAVERDTATLFYYLNQHWFSWPRDVNAVSSPVINDPWERVYFTGDGYPKVTNNQIFSGSNMPASSYRLGIQAPEHPIQATVEEDAEPDIEPNDDETRYYTHTFVTEQGEEGPPGQASQRIDLKYPEAETTKVHLALLPPNANHANITHRRIYRTVTGGGISDYLLVAELPIADAHFVDDRKGDTLGGKLETYDYQRPDENLEGLVMMANGILAGFVGNTLHFSEAYLPYAWPEKYQHTTEHKIVALVATGNTLTVLTEGRPWLFTGVTPANMSGRNLEFNQACISKRSVKVVNGSVIYASPDGLVSINPSGVQLLTGKILTRQQWQQYRPETLHAYAQENRYLAFYGDHQAFILDPEMGDLRNFNLAADCGFSSVLDDVLYLKQPNGSLVQWEMAEEVLTYQWHSKAFKFSDLCFSAARIQGDTAKVGFKLFIDDELKYHLPIGEISAAGFRLPNDRGTQWSFELYGTGVVESVTIATSMQEIKGLMHG